MSDGAKPARHGPNEDNPFAAPVHRHEKPGLDADPSVFAEPWMQNVVHAGAPDLLPGLNDDATTDIEPDETVWDEPALAKSLSGKSLGETGFSISWKGRSERRSRFRGG